MIGEFKLKRLGRLAALAFFTLIALSCNNSPSSDNVKVSEAEWKAAFDKLIKRGSDSSKAAKSLTGKDSPQKLTADEGFVLTSTIENLDTKASTTFTEIITPGWSVAYTADKKSFLVDTINDGGHEVRLYYAGESVEYEYKGKFYYNWKLIADEEDGESWFGQWCLVTDDEITAQVSMYEELSQMLTALRDAYSALDDEDGYKVYMYDSGDGGYTFDEPEGDDHFIYSFELEFSEDSSGEKLITKIIQTIDDPGQDEDKVEEMSVSYNAALLKYEIEADEFALPNDKNINGSNSNESGDNVNELVLDEDAWDKAFDKLMNRGASSEENDHNPLMRFPLFNLVGKDGDDSDENSDESEPVTLSADSGFVLRSVVYNVNKDDSVNVEHIVTPEWSVFHTEEGKYFVIEGPLTVNGELRRGCIFLAGEQADYKFGGEFYFNVAALSESDIDEKGCAKEDCNEKWSGKWQKAGAGESIYERLSALLPALKSRFDSKSIKEDKDGSFTATVTMAGDDDNSYDIECVFKDKDGEILVTEIKSEKESLFGYTSYMSISYINEETEYTIVNDGFVIPTADTVYKE